MPSPRGHIRAAAVPRIRTARSRPPAQSPAAAPISKSTPLAISAPANRHQGLLLHPRTVYRSLSACGEPPPLCAHELRLKSITRLAGKIAAAWQRRRSAHVVAARCASVTVPVSPLEKRRWLAALRKLASRRSQLYLEIHECVAAFVDRQIRAQRQCYRNDGHQQRRVAHMPLATAADSQSCNPAAPGTATRPARCDLFV